MILGDFRRNRIEQRQLDHAGLQESRDGGARVAVIAALGEMREHVGLCQRPHGLQSQQFGIARPGADADQAALERSIHRPALASALMHAAVMALPPSRPRTMAKGTR